MNEVGGSSHDVSSVNVAGLDELVSSMNDAVEALGSELEPIRALARSHGFDFGAMGRVAAVRVWVEEQIPSLERRRNVAAGLAGDRPESATVLMTEPPSRMSLYGPVYEDEFATPQEAEQFGRELAVAVGERVDATRPLFGEPSFEHPLPEDFVAVFEQYVHDPDVMAGFFLELGPEYTEYLPQTPYGLSEEIGDEGDLERFGNELVSIGLGTAMNAQDHFSSSTDYRAEFEVFWQHFSEPLSTGDPDRDRAWQQPNTDWGPRLELLQHGSFPPEFVAGVVHGSINHGDTFLFAGVPETFVLGFDILADNPAAARLFFDHPDGPSLDEYVAVLASADIGLDGTYSQGLNPTGVEEVLPAFMRAIAAGTGVLDTPPDKSPEAAEFTFEFMTALSKHEPSSPVVLGAMSESLDLIGAGWAQELLLGAQQGTWPASTERPDGFQVPFDGVEPGFYLDQQTVYSFLYWLDNEPGQESQFDNAVANLANDLPDVIAADMAALENGDAEISENAIAAFEMFGTLHGMNFTSTEHLWRRFDTEEADRRNEQMVAASYLLIAAGFLTGVVASPTKGYYAGWGFFALNVSTTGWRFDYVGKGAKLPDLEKPDWLNEHTERIVMVNLLLESGYPHGDIPAELANESGEFFDPVKIGEEGLEDEFEEWIRENERTDLPAFDTQLTLLADAFGAGGIRSDAVAWETGWGEPPFGGGD